MEIGIIIGLAIGAVAIYLDFKNKAKTLKSQLERLTVSTASFVRRGQLMEKIMTDQQKEEYTKALEQDVVAKLIMETDVTKRAEHLKSQADSEEEQYYEIMFRVGAMKGSGE